MLYTPKKEEDAQRHSTFKTKCTVNERVCNLIIDSGSSKNIVFKTMVDKLQFKTHKHLFPYHIGCIKYVSETKVTEQYCISFSIERYNDEVNYDVVDMNACDMLLEILEFNLNKYIIGRIIHIGPTKIIWRLFLLQWTQK